MNVEALATPPIESTNSPAPTGSILDLGNTVKLIKQLDQKYDLPTSRQIGAEIIKEDMKALSWEATKSSLPNTFFYKIIRENGQVKLVHQSDLHWNRDIMDGVTNYRRGLERKAIGSLKWEAIGAGVGESRFIISAQKDETESSQDCFYQDSHLHLLEKVSEDMVAVREFQNPNLNRLRSIALFNLLDQDGIMNPNSNIDTLITTVGKTMKRVDTLQVLKHIGYLTGQEHSNSQLYRFKQLEIQINFRAEQSARIIYQAIQNGVEGEALEALYGRLLMETAGAENLQAVKQPDGTMAVITSCGQVIVGPRLGIGRSLTSPVEGQSQKDYCVGANCSSKGKQVEVGPCKLCNDCAKTAA